MKKILETSRLYLREMTPDDAEEAYRLNLDPEVIRYTGDVAFESAESARTFLEKYSDYERNGIGRWAMIRKSDETFLGWCGLKRHADDSVDVGYRLHRIYWGAGYATEAALACLEYGFQHCELNEIVAHATVSNQGSIRVLEKIGMQYLKEVEDDSFPERVSVYALSMEQWNKQ